ncbi:hypothetical protein GT347_17460 [Xylophilus rhododendri]|uniref:Uncharacterized protein n=1 Tax=Xylophilus rhododendri TaxID=2697032 RepID=A0A857J6I2_9BURK|nr:hypothetical protein [Xylophilus rhododendri]QHI99604.1 hypothetical protein GT347_17460 [Xylophilus rhododendri]
MLQRPPAETEAEQEYRECLEQWHPRIAGAEVHGFAMADPDQLFLEFLSRLALMDRVLLGRQDPRALARDRKIRELVAAACTDACLRQRVVDEIRDQPPGCLDVYHARLDDLDRLRRLGRVESVASAAKTALREAMLKAAHHKAATWRPPGTAMAGIETMTTYALLAHAVHHCLHLRYGWSPPSSGRPAHELFSPISYAEALVLARRELKEEETAAYARAADEAAAWPEWLAFADKVPRIAAQIGRIEASARVLRDKAARARSGSTEEAEYAVVLDKDVRIAELKKAVIVQALRNARQAAARRAKPAGGGRRSWPTLPSA